MSPASLIVPEMAATPAPECAPLPAEETAAAPFAMLMGAMTAGEPVVEEESVVLPVYIPPADTAEEIRINLAVAMLAALPFTPPPPPPQPTDVAEVPVPVIESQAVALALPVTPREVPVALDQPAAKNLPPEFAWQSVEPVEAEQIALPTPPKPPETPRAELPAEPVGTDAAKQGSAMKTMENVEATARRAEKNLPRGQVLPETPVPVAEVSLARAAAVFVAERPGKAEAKISPVAMPVADRPAVIAAADVAPVTKPAAVERVFAAVTERIVTFKRVGLESLDVNVKPDQQTEINLQLSLRHGQVEVVARLERGEWANLQGNWSDLQQNLAQQGIRLSRLVPVAGLENNFAQTMSGGFGRSSDRQMPAAPETFDAVLPTPARSRAASAGVRRAQGWEMWA